MPPLLRGTKGVSRRMAWREAGGNGMRLQQPGAPAAQLFQVIHTGACCQAHPSHPACNNTACHMPGCSPAAAIKLWMAQMCMPAAHQVGEAKLCGSLPSVRHPAGGLLLLLGPLGGPGWPLLACACCRCRWRRQWARAAARLLSSLPLLRLCPLLQRGGMPALPACCTRADAATAAAIAPAGRQASRRAAGCARRRRRGGGAAAQVGGVLLAHLEAEGFHAHSIGASLQGKGRVPACEGGRVRGVG